jgi:hypothetical protein
VRTAVGGSVRIDTVCREAASSPCTTSTETLRGARAAASVTPESGAIDADGAGSPVVAAVGAGCSGAVAVSGETGAAAGDGGAGSGEGAAAGGATAEGAWGAGVAVFGGVGAGFAGVDDGPRTGSAVRAGRKDSGSRYPFGSEVVRTPMCT